MIGKKMILAATTVGLASTAIALAAPSMAAGEHGISGTPYSGCTNHTWYYSTNARYKAGTGLVKVTFSDIGKNGLNFKIVDAHNATLGHVGSWTNQETDEWQTLDSSVANNTKFYNAFEEQSTGCNTNDHDFTGTEYY
jgi:hypothetical protein